MLAHVYQIPTLLITTTEISVFLSALIRVQGVQGVRGVCFSLPPLHLPSVFCFPGVSGVSSPPCVFVSFSSSSPCVFVSCPSSPPCVFVPFPSSLLVCLFLFPLTSLCIFFSLPPPCVFLFPFFCVFLSPHPLCVFFSTSPPLLCVFPPLSGCPGCPGCPVRAVGPGGGLSATFCASLNKDAPLAFRRLPDAKVDRRCTSIVS